MAVAALYKPGIMKSVPDFKSPCDVRSTGTWSSVAIHEPKSVAVFAPVSIGPILRRLSKFWIRLFVQTSP